MRERKIQLQHAGELFNAKPKKGVKELEKLGLLEKDGTVEERAAVLGHFLRNTSGLDKTKIGEFIGGGDDEASEQLRKAYVSTFNVDGRSVVSSLRMFLGNFRLPGEAQQIDRILQVRRFKQNKKIFLLYFFFFFIIISPSQCRLIVVSSFFFIISFVFF